MIAWIVITIVAVWVVLSAVVVTAICMASSKFNQGGPEIEGRLVLESAAKEDRAVPSLAWNSSKSA